MKRFIQFSAIIACGIGIISLSFWATLVAIDRLDQRQHRAGQISQAHTETLTDTRLIELPRFPASSQADWDAMQGLHVERGERSRAGSRLPVLSLRPSGRGSLHRVSISFSGLPSGLVHVTAWAKSAGTPIVIEARDGNSKNVGSAVYDLVKAAVVATQGSFQHASLARDDQAWLKASFDILSSDGVIIVYIRLLNEHFAWEFSSAAGGEVDFGGITAVAKR